MRKLLKSLTFVGFFREGAGSGLEVHSGWILGPFWEHVGAQNREKGDPETLTKNDGKKETQDFSANAGSRGGAALKTLVNSILKPTHIDPLSLHCVPQGHGGGYIFLCSQGADYSPRSL